MKTKSQEELCGHQGPAHHTCKLPKGHPTAPPTPEEPYGVGHEDFDDAGKPIDHWAAEGTASSNSGLVFASIRVIDDDGASV